MKTLQQHIQEKLIINKDTKLPKPDELVDWAIENNTEIIQTSHKYGDVRAFKSTENFLNCLDDLGIEYEEVKNKKYSMTDFKWYELKHPVYSPLHKISLKFIRIGKPVQNNNSIIIRIGNAVGAMFSTTWLLLQSIFGGGSNTVGISNQDDKILRYVLEELVKHTGYEY